MGVALALLPLDLLPRGKAEPAKGDAGLRAHGDVPVFDCLEERREDLRVPQRRRHRSDVSRRELRAAAEPVVGAAEFDAAGSVRTREIGALVVLPPPVPETPAVESHGLAAAASASATTGGAADAATGRAAAAATGEAAAATTGEAAAALTFAAFAAFAAFADLVGAAFVVFLITAIVGADFLDGSAVGNADAIRDRWVHEAEQRKQDEKDGEEEAPPPHFGPLQWLSWPTQ